MESGSLERDLIVQETMEEGEAGKRLESENLA
jgi:hypothetical protein